MLDATHAQAGTSKSITLYLFPPCSAYAPWGNIGLRMFAIFLAQLNSSIEPTSVILWL